MMPWEHVVVGYVAYSLFVHIFYRDSPSGGETVAVVFASLLPDIIDKPLAWEYGVFDAGYALGHSIFFAIPLSMFVFLLAYVRGRPRIGWAFAIGYILHLPADVIPIYIQRGTVPIDRILWPVRPVEGGTANGFTDNFWGNMDTYLELLYNVDQSLYMQGVVGLMLFSVLLWIYDGMPVVRELWLAIRHSFRVVVRAVLS